MAKLTINLRLPMPRLLSEDIHVLLEECGYELVEQKMYFLQYLNGDQRVTFDANGRMTYDYLFPAESDRSAGWFEMAVVNVDIAMTDMNKMLLLQCLGVIDFTRLPEYRQYMRFSHSKNTMIINRQIVSGPSGHKDKV